MWEWERKSVLAIKVCHHSASLVMLNSDLRDGFFYASLTLFMGPYNLTVEHTISLLNALAQRVILSIFSRSVFLHGHFLLISFHAWFYQGFVLTENDRFSIRCFKVVAKLQSNFDGLNSLGPSVRVQPINGFERYLVWQFSREFPCTLCIPWTPRFYLSKLLSARDFCHLCQFTPLHARVKIIRDRFLQFSSAESKYLDQHVLTTVFTCWSMHLTSHFSCLVVLWAMTYKLAWMFKTKMRIRLYSHTVWCPSESMQHTVSGYYQPASETSFECCFACGPIFDRF